jgi:type II secretory pathway pseudopilin PulG
MFFRMKSGQREFRHGFTLIEALTLLFLFSVITMSFYQTWSLSTQHMFDARNRLGATALANQKMEMVRSLDYDIIGTKSWNGSSWVYGIPGGDILENETVQASNASFQVHTAIRYIDDPYDGTLGGSPNDIAPTDYKTVRIAVSWGTGGPSREVVTFATVSPEGVESASNTGVLSINVLNAAGDGVAGASVRVVNTALGVDFTDLTDATGNLMRPGAAPGTQDYEITVTKNGYYGVQTYPAPPASSFDPLDLHASVAAAAVNQKSLIKVDESADITIRTEDPFGTAISDVDFSMKGGRQIGTVPLSSPLEPVYGFVQTDDTGGSGEVSYSDESYGQYFFALDVSESGYEIFHESTETNATKETIDVLPGETKTAAIVLLDKTFGSLLVTVKDDTSGGAIPNASVRLTNVGLGYDATVSTNANGQAFFPVSSPALAAGTYDIETTATGYVTDTGTEAIAGNALGERIVNLTAS